MADYFDKLGNYKKADILDKYIKTSQLTPLRATQDPLLEEMNQFFGSQLEFQKSRTGPSSILTTQGSRRLEDVQELDQLTPVQLYQLSLQPGGAEEIRKRFVELGQIIAGYGANTSAETLNNLLEFIQPLLQARPDLVDQNLQNNLILLENIAIGIKNYVVNESNLNNIIKTIQNLESKFSNYSSFVSLSETGVIFRGLSQAYAEMKISGAPEAVKKADEMTKNGTLNKYIRK